MEKDFLRRVFAIAFTDSVHSLSLHDAPNSVIKAFQKVSTGDDVEQSAFVVRLFIHSI